MSDTLSVAYIASLIGDPARANMLHALMDGRALTAGELAYAGHISPQPASGHLAKLTEGGLLSVVKQGRHRYFRIATPRVAELLETIMTLATEPERERTVWRSGKTLRRARMCYDHLAGKLGVVIASRLGDRGMVILTEDGGSLTDSGAAFLKDTGIDVDALRAKRRAFCRSCLDWSERRFHIAGSVGAAIATHCLEHGWIERSRENRVVHIPERGFDALNAWLDCDLKAALSTDQSGVANNGH